METLTTDSRSPMASRLLNFQCLEIQDRYSIYVVLLCNVKGVAEVHYANHVGGCWMPGWLDE